METYLGGDIGFAQTPDGFYKAIRLLTGMTALKVFYFTKIR
jgi:hypothetical protein